MSPEPFFLDSQVVYEGPALSLIDLALCLILIALFFYAYRVNYCLVHQSFMAREIACLLEAPVVERVP